MNNYPFYNTFSARSRFSFLILHLNNHTKWKSCLILLTNPTEKVIRKYIFMKNILQLLFNGSIFGKFSSNLLHIFHNSQNRTFDFLYILRLFKTGVQATHGKSQFQQLGLNLWTLVLPSPSYSELNVSIPWLFLFCRKTCVIIIQLFYKENKPLEGWFNSALWWLIVII